MSGICHIHLYFIPTTVTVMPVTVHNTSPNTYHTFFKRELSILG